MKFVHVAVGKTQGPPLHLPVPNGWCPPVFCFSRICLLEASETLNAPPRFARHGVVSRDVASSTTGVARAWRRSWCPGCVCVFIYRLPKCSNHDSQCHSTIAPRHWHWFLFLALGQVSFFGTLPAMTSKQGTTSLVVVFGLGVVCPWKSFASKSWLNMAVASIV